MAEFMTGAEGEVVITGGPANLEIKGWDFDPTVAELDVSSTGTAGSADFDPGLRTATGSFNAVWDASGSKQPTPNLDDGTEQILQLYIGSPTGKYISVPKALITGLPMASVVDGQVTWTCNFRAKYDSGIGACWVMV